MKNGRVRIPPSPPAFIFCYLDRFSHPAVQCRVRDSASPLYADRAFFPFPISINHLGSVNRLLVLCSGFFVAFVSSDTNRVDLADPVSGWPAIPELADRSTLGLFRYKSRKRGQLLYCARSEETQRIVSSRLPRSRLLARDHSGLPITNAEPVAAICKH